MSNPKKTSTKIAGSCLCGAVTFTIQQSRILLFNNCFCGNCRKNTGTGSTAQLQVAADGFEFRSGEALIHTFESSPGVHRAFCSQCGSRLPRRNGQELVAVPAGTLDVEPDFAPQVNLFTATRPSWAAIDETLESLPGQGSPAFWRDFMARKTKPIG